MDRTIVTKMKLTKHCKQSIRYDNVGDGGAQRNAYIEIAYLTGVFGEIPQEIEVVVRLPAGKEAGA